MSITCMLAASLVLAGHKHPSEAEGAWKVKKSDPFCPEELQEADNQVACDNSWSAESYGARSWSPV
jgi:hypothetical protein